MFRLRYVVIGTLLMFATGILGACAQGTTPVPSAPPQTTPPAPAASSGADADKADMHALPDGEIVGTKELVKAAQAEGKVVYYTAQSAEAETQHAKLFTERFGIPVEVIRLAGGRLQERILTEVSAGRLGADVITQSDITLLEDLRGEGILAEHTPPADKMFADKFKSPGVWYAPHTSIQQIGYRTDRIAAADAPKTWQDLLNPKWKGNIGLVQPYAGGTTWTLTYFLRKELGLDYMKQLAAQEPVIYPGAAAAGQGLLAGEVDIVVTGDTQIVRFKLEGAPVQEVYPPKGVATVIYGMSIAKSAPHPNAARLFYNWYLSREAGESITGLRGTYGSRSDVVGAEGKAPPATVNFWVPDMEGFMSMRDEWLNEWAAILGYR